MRALVVGGFSRAVKEALVKDAISKAKGRTTVFLNGEEDFVSGSEAAADKDLSVEVFGEGCFCCVLRDVLTEALREQRERRRPDELVMTASVLADLALVEGLMRKILGDDLALEKAYGLDLENAEAILEAFPDMTARNLMAADMVLIALRESANEKMLRSVEGRLALLAGDLHAHRRLIIEGESFSISYNPDRVRPI